MPKISPAQRETRRRQILDAALRCFSRDGFHNTTTADIVRESGVSQGTLYLYFATKDEMIAAFAEDRHQREALLNALALREQDPIRGLYAMIELHGTGLTDPGRRDAFRVGVQGWAEALRNPDIHKSVVGGTATVHEAIIRLVERGQNTGQIRPEIDPASVARTLIAVFQGLVLHLAWDEAVDLHGCGRVIHDMIGALLTPEGLAAYAQADTQRSACP
jgi:AcrR family transcriptional regulator